MDSRWVVGSGACVIALGFCLVACSADSATPQHCSPGSMISCACPNNPAISTRCAADGSQYQPCSCGAPITGTAGTMVSPPLAGMPVTTFPTAGMSLPTAGMSTVGGRPASMLPPRGGAAAVATAGMPAAAGGGAAAGGAGATNTGVPADELEMLRNVCVEEINKYRAMLPNLKPMKRATPAQEMCSDKGAQQDGDSMQAHGSAKMRLCSSVGLFAENTCPGWPVGRQGVATIADALKNCLKQMWAEGEPPNGRPACIMDTAGCFQMHGHYLNMSDTTNGSVACSFYKMKSGAYWMNQDFAR